MLNLVAVALVYGGLIGMAIGAVSVVRPLRALGIQTPLSGVAVFSAFAILLIAGVFLPAPEQSASPPQSDLDRAMPVWQFGEPLLDVVLRSGFMTISDRPANEMVLTTRIARGVTATINFHIAPNGDGTWELATGTRVFASDGPATRAFAAYWRLIHPGSSLIRIMWLRAIRLRAEI